LSSPPQRQRGWWGKPPPSRASRALPPPPAGEGKASPLCSRPVPWFDELTNRGVEGGGLEGAWGALHPLRGCGIVSPHPRALRAPPSLGCARDRLPASGGGAKRRPFLTFRPVGFQKPGGLFLCRTSTLGLQRREQGAARDGGRQRHRRWRDHHLHLRRRPVLSDVLSAAEGRSRRNGARVKKVDGSGTTYYVPALSLP